MIRMRDDNVLIAFEPLEEKVNGIILPDFSYIESGKHVGKTEKRHTLSRKARVLSVGPGHYPGCKKCGGVKCTFIPTELKVGDRVIVPANTGEDYSMDISAPRHHTTEHKFSSFEGVENAEMRILREGQVLAVVE